MSLEQLLQIQSIDVESNQLRHRRKTLDQRAELEVARSRRVAEQAMIDEVAAERVDAASRQRRLEDEAQIVATKASVDESRLYNGEVTGMKDLQALQDEIKGLKARQESIEDEALLAMEEVETLGGRAANMEQSCSSLDQRIAILVEAITKSEEEIDARLADLSMRRESAVAETGETMLADYEQLRPRFGSATVVRFDGRNCVGCPSIMPSVEVDRLRHVDTGVLEHCSECGRMVVT